MNAKIIPFTLILMLFLSPAALLVNAQDDETEPSPIVIEEEPVDPIILALIREQAQTRTQEMIQIFGSGPYSPEIMNGLSQAQRAMEEAMNFETSDPNAATQQYLRAIRQYRNTLRKYLNENPGALDEFEGKPEGTGTATDDMEGTVTDTELGEAQTRLIEEFEERFRNQITAMIQNVNDVSDDMDPQDAFKAQQALTKAEEKLLRIQERISTGQYEDALDDLEDATDTLTEDFDDMDDPGTAQMLKTMNQLEAKIKKMEQKAEKNAAKGQSTAEEDALLAELRGNKDHTKNDYKENKGQGNSGNNGKPDKDKDKPEKEKKDKDK